ncbi:endoribonuclease L-PSP [Podospora australis]|uniref:Endoribonuclease L-PSP n=1 Tax=Podospora australis TaxID=1536484 RepID=A0AAN6WPW3_9PEZI|nr:endoribonuclease L-PSP [Podospora australis]
MSSLKYFTYPTYGDTLSDQFHYSQAVRVENRIEISGQGGWDPKTGTIPEDIAEEIDQAFSNVDLVLKTAGGKGWSQVYRINAYITAGGFTEEGLGAFAASMKKWCGPDHRPLLTAIGASQLAFEEMRVEIEVVALLNSEKKESESK